MSIDILDRLSIDYPVFQAPMGGGISNSTLVRAVSKSGGLGALGHSVIDEFQQEIKTLKQTLGKQPFSVNLLMPVVTVSHIETCIKEKVPVVSIFHGYEKGLVAELKNACCIVCYQVGSSEEADKVVADGVDVLVVQGREAGGHLRGNTPLDELLPVIRERHPDMVIIGAGGVHDTVTAKHVISLGANGVAAGTRFLLSAESGAHTQYKEKLLKAKKTVVTSLFGLGWHSPHRVAENAATKRWLKSDGRGPLWPVAINKGAEFVAKHLPLSSDRQERIYSMQRVKIPIYTPLAPTSHMQEPKVECSALYAGKCVSEITSIESVDTIVKELGTALIS